MVIGGVTRCCQFYEWNLLQSNNSLYTYDCVTASDTIVKFADNTVVVGLISDNTEKAHLEEIANLENWCQENNLFLNVSKTKELMD